MNDWVLPFSLFMGHVLTQSGSVHSVLAVPDCLRIHLIDNGNGNTQLVIPSYLQEE